MSRYYIDCETQREFYQRLSTAESGLTDIQILETLGQAQEFENLKACEFVQLVRLIGVDFLWAVGSTG